MLALHYRSLQIHAETIVWRMPVALALTYDITAFVKASPRVDQKQALQHPVPCAWTAPPLAEQGPAV